MSRLLARTIKIDRAAAQHMGPELIVYLKDLACDSSLLVYYLSVARRIHINVALRISEKLYAIL